MHHVTYANPEQAALVAALAGIGIRGSIEVPKSCCGLRSVSGGVAKVRIKRAEEHFTGIAASRTGTQSLQEKTAGLLMHWYIHGKHS